MYICLPVKTIHLPAPGSILRCPAVPAPARARSRHLGVFFSVPTGALLPTLNLKQPQAAATTTTAAAAAAAAAVDFRPEPPPPTTAGSELSVARDPAAEGCGTNRSRCRHSAHAASLQTLPRDAAEVSGAGTLAEIGTACAVGGAAPGYGM